MKKATIIFSIFIITQTYSQVAIGKSTLTTTGSILLEFDSSVKKGIILPSVASATGVSGGTFIFNTTDKAVEVWEEKNNSNAGGWTLLTDSGQGVTHSYANSGADVGNGVIIGASTSTKSGILILESTTKAMVLPLVGNPHTQIKGAIAGTMVYDTVSSSLAIYDGANWSYWK